MQLSNLKLKEVIHMKFKSTLIIIFTAVLILSMSSCSNDTTKSEISSTNPISIINSIASSDFTVQSILMSQTSVGDYTLIHDSELRTEVIDTVTYIYFDKDNFVMADCDTSVVYNNNDLTEELAGSYFSKNLTSLSTGNYSDSKIISGPEEFSFGNQPGYKAVFSTNRLGNPIYVESILFLNNGHFSTITLMCNENDYEKISPQFEEMISAIS